MPNIHVFRDALMPIIHGGRETLIPNIHGGRETVMPKFHGGRETVIPNIHGGRETVMPNIHGGRETVLLNIHGGRETIMPNIHGGRETVMPSNNCGRETEIFNILGGREIVLPNVHGGRETVMPNIHGGRETAKPNIHGGSVTVLPNIHGGRETVMPNILGGKETEIPNIHGGRETVLPKIHGGRETVMPNIHVGRETVIPNIHVGRETVMPKIHGGRETVIPNIHGGRETVMPNIHVGRETVMPSINCGRKTEIPNFLGGRGTVLPNIHVGRETLMPNIHGGREKEIPNIHGGRETVMPNIHGGKETEIPNIHGGRETVLPKIHGGRETFFIAYRLPRFRMAESDAQRRFSEQLCRVLKMDGVSQSRLKTLRSWIYINEVILKHLHNQRILFSGSAFEGSETEGSDVDQMWIMPGITAVKGQKEIDIRSGYVFLLETTDVRPGYTKLVLMKKSSANAVPEETKEATRKAVEESLFQAKNTEWYFSSEQYTDFHLRMMKETDKFSSLGTTKPSFYGHGPCATTSYSNTTSLGICATESDIALGIECINWPLQAEEWFERKRKKSWPGDKLVEAIRMMPCYILPVGDSKSKTEHLEWRFAFVPAERELVWSFNDCQIQCYSILKFLKRKYLNTIGSDELSSFCLKTIVFWISEEEGLEMWTPPTLLECIRRCLIRLQESIESTFLPHYFLRKRNLLFGKFEDEEVKQFTMTKISEIIESIIPSILECDSYRNSSMENYFRLWPLCGKDLFAFLDTNQRLVPDDLIFFSEIEHIQKLTRCNDANMSVVHLPTSFEALVDTVEALDKLPLDIDRDLIKSTKSFLGIRAGMTLLAEVCISTYESMKAELISSITACFDDGINMDGVCGRLYMCTFHSISGSTEKAEAILREIVSGNRVVFYGGQCGKASHISMVRGNQVELIDNNFTITISTISFDMVFTSTDIYCVPQGLQYECALLSNNMNWNFCLIHPVVYAQYLHFEIAHASKNPTEFEESLRYLSDAVKNVEGSFEEHRALNLLGLCYVKSGRMRHAIECFVRSLLITPTVGNAACYHLCVIVYCLLDESGTI
ncbi:hypothetical protein CHS0354_004971 [Potamilus streckersoni]|uniref:Mab-21-like HhH/H2TH-like domain-containing protein n=1 Tax=Potamilus streckersoni TaxID=2493646 RepID=A0AAE0SSH5_9BIVA|nr:hypothetical protein CHS0354_004971 [Potamilus streckersoni]